MKKKTNEKMIPNFSTLGEGEICWYVSSTVVRALLVKKFPLHVGSFFSISNALSGIAVLSTVAVTPTPIAPTDNTVCDALIPTPGKIVDVWIPTEPVVETKTLSFQLKL